MRKNWNLTEGDLMYEAKYQFLPSESPALPDGCVFALENKLVELLGYEEGKRIVTACWHNTNLEEIAKPRLIRAVRYARACADGDVLGMLENEDSGDIDEDDSDDVTDQVLGNLRY